MSEDIIFKYYKLFSSPIGHEVLDDLKQKVGLKGTPILPDFDNSNKLFYIKGQQDLVRQIESMVVNFEKESINE